jgi:hypothetical protein
MAPSARGVKGSKTKTCALLSAARHLINTGLQPRCYIPQSIVNRFNGFHEGFMSCEAVDTAGICHFAEVTGSKAGVNEISCRYTTEVALRVCFH